MKQPFGERAFRVRVAELRTVLQLLYLRLEVLSEILF